MQSNLKRANFKRAILKVLLGLFLVSAFALGGYRLQAAHPETTDHLMILPREMKWADAPPSLPPGAKVALMEGDPTQKGPFTMRLQLPANYRIPAHHHPTDEHVTVISGSLYMGLGDRLDTTKGRALTPGSFALMKTGIRHFAYTRKPAVIQLHGVGPWGIVYVDPKEDPRNR